MNDTRRRPAKRTRSSMRTAAVSRRVPRSIRYNGETAFTRTANTSIICGPNGFAIGASNFPALSFQFDPAGFVYYGSAVASAAVALPNAAEIAAFWDLVAIDKVEMTFTSTFDPSTVTTANLVPRLIIATDYNTGGAGTSLDAIYEHSDAKPLDGTITKWTVRPKYQRIVYYTALTSSYEPSRGFVNADTAIPHYGVLLGIRDFPSLTSGRLNVNCKFFFRAKNNK